MKKICYITTISGTIKAFFVSQIKFLFNNGYDVTVICSPDEKLQEMLGNNIHYIPVNISRGVSPRTIIKSIKELKKIFIEERFDLVQYSTPNAAFCASIAAKSAKIKVRNYHLMGFRYFGCKGILRKILKLLEVYTCENSTHIECVSESNRKIGISEHIFPAEKAVVVWNGSTGGVNLKRFDFNKRQVWRKEIRQKYNIDEDTFVFGFAGRITRDKGVNELLEAFEKISGDCILLIVGAEEGVDTLDHDLFMKAKNDNRIIFAGSVNEIEKYFSAMDINVLPSYREGFGNVIIESAAVGTPAIVTNIPGPVDVVINKKTGLLINKKDADDLFEKMQMCLNNRKMCKEMSDSCRSFVKEKFNSEVLCKKILDRKIQLLND